MAQGLSEGTEAPGRVLVKLLFLDDDPARIPMLPRQVELHYVRTPKEFVEWLQANGTPDCISFDHDLAEAHYSPGYVADGTGTGADCAGWAIENGFIPRIIHIHSWNSVGAQKIFNLFVNHFNAEPFEESAIKTTIVVRPFNLTKPHLWTE